MAPTPPIPDPGRWLTLGVVLSAAFLVVLDFFIVNVSIPVIQASLHATPAQIQLVIATYGLAYAMLLITGGRLGDIYGRKRVFILGVAGFTLTSLVCGIAPTPASLIAARTLQGVMGGLMFPQVLSIMQVSFTGKERGTAFGLFGTIVGTASFFGNVLGGLLVQANLWNLSWRPIFLLNLPVGIAAITAASYWIRESRSPKARRLDLMGVVLISTAVFLLIYPLVLGREAGWPAWSFICIAISILLVFVFVSYERGVERRNGSPLIELTLFKDRGFVVGLLSGVCFFSSAAAFFLILTIFLQNGLGFSPRAAGLTFAPFAITFLAGSLVSVRLYPRIGSRIINLGAGLMTLGLIAIIWLARSQGASLNGFALAVPLLVYGFGQGFVMPNLITTILMNISGQDAGSASGVFSTVQQVSFSLGVAGVGSVFFSLLGRNPRIGEFVHAISVALTCNIALLTLTSLLILLFSKRSARVIGNTKTTVA